MADKTIGTYTEGKGFNHKGVSPSTSVDRLTENGGKGITPDVMKMGVGGVEKVVHNKVKESPVGTGMDSNAGKVDTSGGSGVLGKGTNVNHA